MDRRAGRILRRRRREIEHGTEIGKCILAFVERVTMTLPVLAGAAQVVYLVLGEAKAEAVKLAFACDPDPAIPASLLRSEHGETIVLLDRAAAARLDNGS